MYKQHSTKIDSLRLQGFSPTAIANLLGISVNTVKSHIRRHPVIPDTVACQCCNNPVVQTPGRKTKRFCSDKCRITYWNNTRKKGA
ncbi:MAG: hypothetical protein IJ435_10090 [Clostridia bacterium]|nr:hypothetical protein [Clostridia bacterium]